MISIILYNFIKFYIILYNFINCIINLALQSSNRVNIIGDTFFYALLPYVCCPFLGWVRVCSGCFRQVFFIWETKKVVAGRVRQVVVLYSSNCMGICLGGLRYMHIRSIQVDKFSKNWNLFSKQPSQLKAADNVWYAILK